MPRSTLLRPGRGVAVRPEANAAAERQVREAAFGRMGAHLVSPHEISPNPRNPRKVFDERALNELAGSIQELGQLQPVLVRRVDDALQLVAGERRWRAIVRAGLDTIWVVEKQVSDLAAYKMALAENLNREGLSQAERVAALDELAEMVGEQGLRPSAREMRISAPWLLAQVHMRRDPVIFPALEAGAITFRMADEIRKAPAHARRGLLDRVLRERPTYEAVREWVRAIKGLEREGRSEVAAIAAGAPAEGDAFEAVVARLQALGAPGTDLQRAALRHVIELAQRLLEQPTPNTEATEA